MRSDLKPIAGELADALLAFVAVNDGLDEDMLEGAWVIALSCPTDAGANLRSEVTSRSSPTVDAPLLRRIVRDLSVLPPIDRMAHGRRLVTLLSADPAGGAAVLADYDEQTSELVKASLSSSIVERARALSQPQQAQEDAETYERRQGLAEQFLAAVDETLEELLQHEGAHLQAELFFAAMLSSPPIRSRDVIDTHIQSLLEIRDPSVTESCLEVMGTRPAEAAPAWLHALNPEAVWHLSGGTVLLNAVREFAEAFAKDQANAADIRAVAAELERLRAENQWPGTISVSELIPDAGELPSTALEEKLNMIQPLADLDLVDPGELAVTRAVGAANELRRPDHPEMGNEHAILFIRGTLGAVLPMIDTQLFEDLVEACTAAAWLPALEQDRLRLFLDVQAQKRDLTLQQPVDANEIIGDITAYDGALDSEIASWVALDPGNTAITQIIQAYAPRQPAPLLDALKAVTEKATPQRLLQLCEPHLDSRPGPLLEALRFQDTDQKAAALLIARYTAAKNNRDREQVLLLWGALRPTDKDSRRRLIEQIMIPMASLNREALELVLREINLAREPPRTKKLLRDTLRAAGKRFHRDKQVRAKLEALGWSKRAGLIRAHDIDIDTEGEG